MSPESLERKLVALLCADVVGYSRLMAEDESETIRVLTAYRRVIADLVGEHRGRVVDNPGDNVLAEFPTALDAVACAVEIQRVLRARNESLAEQRRMTFRIGVHLGDVSVQDGRLYGDGVNIAARLEGLAEAGQICISAEVHRQVESKLDLDYADLGEQSVKNIPKPVRVYRVSVDKTAGRPRRAAGARTRFAPVVGAVAALAVVALVLAIWSVVRAPAERPAAPSRFLLSVLGDGRLADRSLPPIALAPDGRSVAYVAGTGSTTQLFLRSLDRFEAIPVPGTEGAVSPFFSPDGSWVAFFAAGALRKVPTAGGMPVVVCELSNFDRPSGAWGPDGGIVFSRGINTSSGLLWVDEDGGSPESLTTPRGDRGERWHGLPQPLPSGEVLFTVAMAEGSRAAVLSRESGEWAILDALGPAVAARYLASGHLVFGQPGRLMSVAWRPGEGIRGTPVPVLEDVYTSRRGLPYFDVSRGGSLLYAHGGVVRTVPMLVDRAGNGAAVADDPGAFQHPRISPDGRHLAVDVTWRGRSDIYVYDLERGRRRRLTSEGFNIDPLWTPDGKRILFRSRRTDSSAQAIFWISADGSRPAELLLADADMVPGSWARDGVLPLTSIPAATDRRDLWTLDLASGGPPQPLLRSSHNEGWGAVSPDGSWLAYVSDESGADEIWVRPFRAAGPAEQVSADGGIEPVWSPDGAELFYRQGDRFLAVDVETEPRIRSGAPRELFRGRYDRSPTGHQHYDVAPDGQHFAVIGLGGGEDLAELRLIVDWASELERLVPGGP
ncbi:MAG: hypothetical protein O7G30_14330 [Proteobacteria bacterium]|nr:hypothetical protein [Pseudomonadota bacterium]